MKQASFRKRIGVGVGLSAISVLFQFLSFCVNNLLAHVLGPGAFADYALLSTDFSLFGAVAEFGTGVVILSFFAGRLRNPSVARAIFRLRLLLALLAAVLMSALAVSFRAHGGLLLKITVGTACDQAGGKQRKGREQRHRRSDERMQADEQ